MLCVYIYVSQFYCFDIVSFLFPSFMRNPRSQILKP